MNTIMAQPVLVVDFDGLLNPMPEGWFDLGAHSTAPARGAVEFLIDATEYFDIVVFGPRSLMFSGIQTMQAAIILWTTMEVNKATMHDLMHVLTFPAEMPESFCAAVNGTGVKWGDTKDALPQEGIEFIEGWQRRLALAAGRTAQGLGASASVRVAQLTGVAGELIHEGDIVHQDADGRFYRSSNNPFHGALSRLTFGDE